MSAANPLFGLVLLALLIILHVSYATAAISLSHVTCSDSGTDTPRCTAGTAITIRGSGFSSLTAPSSSALSSAEPDYYNTTIDNANPRRDVNGDILDSHDGNILLHRGVYYYYGAAYGNCTEINSTSGCTGAVWGQSCGWLLNHNVSLYTSRDLQRWHPHEPVFQIARDFDVPSVMFSPKVIYNNNTKLFVLWFNYNPQSSLGLYGTATSASPFGPFKVRVAPVTTLVNKGPSDSALWADESTGQGFFIYSGAFIVSVEAMTDDYLQTLGAANSSGQVGAYSVEAPAFYYRNGRYHVSTGHLCCYCKEGAMATVYVATNPLGPYTLQANLSAGIPAQQTDIMRYYDQHNTPQFLYRGDRWQQSPDNTKAHDPTAMAAIAFDDNDVAQPLLWLDSFNITVLAGGSSGSGWRVGVVGGGGGMGCVDGEVVDDGRVSCLLVGGGDLGSGSDVGVWLVLEDGAGRAMSTAVEVTVAAAGERSYPSAVTASD